MKRGKNLAVLVNTNPCRDITMSPMRDQSAKEGGVAMYVKKNISYQLCSDLTIMNEKYFESLFILLKVECCELVCGTIYRSPNHSSNAFDVFANNSPVEIAFTLKKFIIS